MLETEKGGGISLAGHPAGLRLNALYQEAVKTLPASTPILAAVAAAAASR